MRKGDLVYNPRWMTDESDIRSLVRDIVRAYDAFADAELPTQEGAFSPTALDAARADLERAVERARLALGSAGVVSRS